MTLDEAAGRIGDTVLYHDDGGTDEEGTITGVNNRVVFVRYGRQEHGTATRPEDLSFVHLTEAGQ